MRIDGASVLITGGGGQLASDLEEQLSERGQVSAPSRGELDITDQGALDDALERVRPAVVFNCAAFHNVDVCEREEDRAFEVNARAVKRLAQGCTKVGAALVHLSTNYVFAGDRDTAYSEADRPSPRSVYAISKLAGEHAALAYCPRALVVRGSGLYGRHGSASKGGNFVQRMVKRARDEGALRMVADQRLSPTYTTELAEAIIRAVEADVYGLLHLNNAGSCSWYEFTLAITDIAGMDVPVEPVQTVRSAGGADRPLNGVLRSERNVEADLSALRPWRAALADYMASAGLAAAANAR